MPKRAGYLYLEIADFKNLLRAFHKAKKGKRNKAEVAEFEYNLERNLLEIEKQLIDRTFQFSGYNFFTIQEPKERLISCAPFKDRVVHHAICNKLEPILDRLMIADTYACRKGKGLHNAIKRAFWMYNNNEYVYKFDIQKYFYTIDHEILLSKVKRKIKDPHLIKLLYNLLDTYNYPTISPTIHSKEFFEENSHEESQLLISYFCRNRGLPIGNLTSQIFANFYFSDFDHFCKEHLHCHYYIRYMDDILIFNNSKAELENVKQIVEKKLTEIRLHVHPDKNQISETKQGVNFLGFRFKDNQIRLQNRNLVRFKRKLHDFASREVSIEDMILSFNGHLGYFNSGHCHNIIKNILDEHEFTDGKKVYKLAV